MTQTHSEFKNSVIGIDMGSYSTKVAAIDKGVVDIITNEANLRQNPSLVGYGPKQRLVGEAGNSKIKSNLNNTVIAPQRYLGMKPSEYTQVEAQYSPCQPKTHEENLVFNVSCQGKQQAMTAEQVTAAFFNKIASIIKMNKLSNKYQIVTVPNYLSQQERQAFLNSIKIARDSQGQTFGYQLISESTAIGFDYGFYKMNDFPQKEEDAKTVLFIDFGHSKLSVYAMKFTKNYQKVIFQKHLRQLGCKNIDQLMFEFYASEFQNKNPNMDISVKESKKATFKLFQQIQKQRKVLSGNSEFDFNIDCLLQDNDFSHTMTRTQLEQISQSVFTTISQFFTQINQQLTQKGIDVGHIQLVGGGSRIPHFIKIVSDSFKIQPSRTLNSSECIARGAALCSAMESGIFRIKEYYAFDVASSDIYCFWKGEGQNIIDEANKMLLVGEGQTLFNQKTIQVILKPTQPKMKFAIQTMNVVSGVNSQICTFSISFPQDEEMMEKKVNITLKMNVNRLLQGVSATLLEQKKISLPIQNLTFSSSLSQDRLSKLIEKENGWLTKDAYIIESYQKRNQFESQFYSIKEQINSISFNRNTKDYINPKVLEQVTTYVTDLQNNLEDITDYNSVLVSVKLRVKQVMDTITQAKQRYSKVKEELNKLSQFINAIVGGKVRSIKYYLGEEFQKVKAWIKTSEQQLESMPKYQKLSITVEQIKTITETLKQKVEECQTQQKRKQQETQREYQRQGSQNQYQSPLNSFGNPFRAHQTPRGRGRNPYNSGFFSDFGRSFF